VASFGRPRQTHAEIPRGSSNFSFHGGPASSLCSLPTTLGLQARDLDLKLNGGHSNSKL
jgi:hypothetical protein